MARFTLEYSTGARKAIRDLPADVVGRIKPAIERLAEEPRGPGATKLKGEDDLWRVRVGDYRIVYHIDDDVVVVTIVRVGDRKEVYR